MKQSSLLAFVSIGLAGILPAPAAKADPVYEATKVTFNQPVEIPGMVLGPGTYVIKLLDPYVDRDIVRFYNADESHMYAMVFAVRDYRLFLTDHPVITFEERANNSPEAIKEWFPTDQNYGEEFVYPKPTPIAVQASVESAPPQTTAVASAPAPAPVPAPAPAPVAQAQPTPAPVQVAQAQPAPAPSSLPAPTPAPAQELPKTASSLPGLTLLGGLLVSAGAILRRKISLETPMRNRLSTILLLAGSAALLWCATVWGGAALFERYQAWRWNTQSSSASPSIKVPPLKLVTPPAAALPAPKLHDVIAWLEIPRLKISTAVLEGDDDLALDLASGHIPGTPLPSADGNVGIAAHRDSFFRSLSGIEPRDRIRLRTPEGEWDYTVESTRIVRPSDVSVLANSRQPELTLVTCYPFHYVGAAPLRFIVRAHRDG